MMMFFFKGVNPLDDIIQLVADSRIAFAQLIRHFLEAATAKEKPQDERLIRTGELQKHG